MDSKFCDLVKNNLKRQSSNECPENVKKHTKKYVCPSKNNVNIGLQVRGSNWKTYKNIVANTTSNNKSSCCARVRKERSNLNPNVVPDRLQSQSIEKKQTFKEDNQRKNVNKAVLTKYIAMDCEMVGIGDGKESMIARVSIVNRHCVCVYDKYVKPTETVKNYRTPISGIRPHHLKNGEDFKVVQKEVADILKGRVLIGHALHNDLNVLFLSHPKWHQRDTSKYFHKFTKGRTPSLKSLAAEFLDLHIQTGEHDSIEDAKTTMLLYKLFKKQWENECRRKY